MAALTISRGGEVLLDLRPATMPPEHEAALVTVVIPARDEEASIAACLDSVLAQDEPNLQVIVIDGDSLDRTRDIVRRYAGSDPRVELLDNSDGSIAKSLNMGLSAARGRWLVRVDAHSVIPPGYVSSLARHLREGSWGGVGGRKDGVATTSMGRAIAAALASPFGVGNSTYHFGTHRQIVQHVPFGAYPTSLLLGLGGWDERLVANEDYELDYRIRRSGHRLLFDPAVSISWRCRQTLRELFSQYRRYGKGKARVALMHPRSISPRHLAAPALVAALVVAAALTPVWTPAFLGILVPYLAALGVASFTTARNAGARHARLRIPGAFLAMHLAWGLGFWQGLAGSVRRRPRSRVCG